MLKPNAPGIKGDLHARLERMDGGMFRAVFAGEMNPEDAAPGQEWPDAHIADTAEGARAWVESMAPQLGYRRVVWDA
jgi:hypothetical protein